MICKSVCSTIILWNVYTCLRPTLTTSVALLFIQHSPTFLLAVVCYSRYFWSLIHHASNDIITNVKHVPIIIYSNACLIGNVHECFCFCTDDMLIKLWDWEKKWSCSQVFEGHTHYVMQIVINPKDNNQFASASLDRTIKVLMSVVILFTGWVLQGTVSDPIDCNHSCVTIMTFHVIIDCFRFGSWALLPPISLWRDMKKESIVLTIIVEEISLTSSQELMTAKSRSGTTRFDSCHSLLYEITNHERENSEFIWYIFSISSNLTVLLFVLQNKTCVQTLEGHAQNVSCVSFHPELPIIITGSEDGEDVTQTSLLQCTCALIHHRIKLIKINSLGTVRIWHSSTYRLESTLNYGMERVWCVCGLRGSNNVALGYDEGSIIIKVSEMKYIKHFNQSF